MKKNKLKPNYFRKSFSIFFLVVFCFSFLVTPQKAKAWDAIAGAQYLFALEQLQKTIDGISIAAAKQAAISTIMEEVDNMIDDFTGMGTAFVTDWEDYLLGIPERESAAFMNDLLSEITQGRSSTRYRNVSVSQTLSYAEAYEGFGAKNAVQFALVKSANAADETSTSYVASNAYAKTINLMGNKIIKDASSSNTPSITCSDEMRANMFDDGNINNFFICTEGLNYAPTAYTYLDYMYNEKKEKEKVIQITQQSGGYLPRTTGEGEEKTVITPAATIEATKNAAQTMPFNMVATANSVYEVIATAVINAVNKSIQQGIGAAKARAQRWLSNTRRKITNSVDDELDKYGPQAIFGNQTFYEQYTSD